MVDMIFSFGELGFQEFETSRYLTTILRENGFSVEEGVSGMPTAWVARWGQGKPVIAFGSDIDCIPKASQKPGVAYHDPIIEGAPGHGEGYNSGQAVNVTAALVLKRLMEREKIPGTLILWPGVAEEQLGAKAYFARDGVMKDVDAVLFTHVSDNLGVSFGPDSSGTDLVSVEYTFKGRNFGGGSDDIGDISWTVPTITLRFPSNIPDLPGHHWANAVAMATPIAHKGATAGAKVMALITLDLLLNPKLAEQAWAYFKNEQGKETQYQSFLSAEDKPSIHLNREIMARYRPEMRKYYFDPSKHKTYLEQLGITYPTIRENADNRINKKSLAR